MIRTMWSWNAKLSGARHGPTRVCRWRARDPRRALLSRRSRYCRSLRGLTPAPEGHLRARASGGWRTNPPPRGLMEGLGPPRPPRRFHWMRWSATREESGVATTSRRVTCRSGTGNCTGNALGACGAGDSCDPGLVPVRSTAPATRSLLRIRAACPERSRASRMLLAFTSESFCYPTDDMLPPCS